MIQRKQSLFLLLSALLNLVLLFVPNQYLITEGGRVPVYLTPLQAPLASAAPHYFTILINFICLLLAFGAIFLYTRRSLQLRLCYVLMVSWLIAALMLLFGSFTDGPLAPVVEKNYAAVAVALAGVVTSWLAARFIKKDIDLLKSADRIR